MNKITYYKMCCPSFICKADNDKYYIYKDGEWIIDKEMIVFGKLIGYDPYEPDDSPYKIGSTSVMDQIEEISEAEAFGLMAASGK